MFWILAAKELHHMKDTRCWENHSDVVHKDYLKTSRVTWGNTNTLGGSRVWVLVSFSHRWCKLNTNEFICLQAKMLMKHHETSFLTRDKKWIKMEVPLKYEIERNVILMNAKMPNLVLLKATVPNKQTKTTWTPPAAINVLYSRVVYKCPHVQFTHVIRNICGTLAHRKHDWWFMTVWWSTLCILPNETCQFQDR